MRDSIGGINVYKVAATHTAKGNAKVLALNIRIAKRRTCLYNLGWLDWGEPGFPSVWDIEAPLAVFTINTIKAEAL